MIGECSKCGKTAEYAKGQGKWCRPCVLEYHTAWRSKNKDHLKAYHEAKLVRLKLIPGWSDSERKRGREYWAELRHDAIMAYGGYVCRCCGETEPKFLNLDHVFNDGSAHRKQIGNRGSGIFKWLKDHSYPAGFQILCFNCNMGKARNKGVCPHKASSHANPANSGEVRQDNPEPVRAASWMKYSRFLGV